MFGAAPGARIFAFLLCVVAAGIPVSALEVPYLSGRVNDQAGLFDETAENALEEKLRALEEETGAQVAVLTVATLDGDPIEDYSLRVVETWKLGREGVDDGVLILVARDDRRMRIEVGYGLEGALTDAQSGRIIDGIMTPKFRAGDYAGGVDSAVDVISSAIRGEELILPEDASGDGDEPIAGLIFLIFGLPFIWTAVGTRGAAGWMFGIFLAPFFFAFSAALFGARIGVIVMAVWLVVFPLLRLIVPKGTAGKGSKSSGGSFWGPFSGGGGGGGGYSGGGFSGGGFSGGGGSFGGGGASGGW
jgi:uncharacterized protein